MAALAANLQQKLSYRLKHEPGAADGVYRIRASGPRRPRLLRIAIIGFFVFTSFVIIVPVAIIIGIIFIIIVRRQNLQQILTADNYDEDNSDDDGDGDDYDKTCEYEETDDCNS